MSAPKIGSCLPDWRKARRSMGTGDCIEIAPVFDNILVRDSKNPGGAVLGYPGNAWRSFVSSAKQGGFDALKLLFLFP
jgi:uncharacterized protein DUF397